MTDEQTERYYRQILLKEIGVKGQRRLMSAKVLIVGAGGLGSPAALYLAAAGVGRLGIVDFDEVDRTNLQRQILHSTKDIGRSKVESAAERIATLNPDVAVESIHAVVHADNVLELIRPWDFIIDGTDNAAAKYLINDACVIGGKPYSHAGVLQFWGQATTYVPGRSPCLRCIFPYSQDHSAPSCDTAGVIGGVCGVIGTLQAMEAIKYLVGAGNLLTGRLLTYDALKSRFTKSAPYPLTKVVPSAERIRPSHSRSTLKTAHGVSFFARRFHDIQETASSMPLKTCGDY